MKSYSRSVWNPVLDKKVTESNVEQAVIPWFHTSLARRLCWKGV
jgi:hypothetical protein